MFRCLMHGKRKYLDVHPRYCAMPGCTFGAAPRSDLCDVHLERIAERREVERLARLPYTV